jgi:outer membrane usher protein
MLARNFSFKPPRKLDQAAVGIPLAFANASVSASYTGLKFDNQPATRIASLSYNQGLFGTGNFFATAFTDLNDSSSYGIFAGVSFPLGGDIVGTAGARRDRDGIAPFAEVSKNVAQEEGSFGFRVRDSEGKPSDRLAAVGYRAGFARLEATAQQTGKSRRGSVEVDGSLIATGGGLFAVNRVDDAFAVVDVGVPDVEVRNENRPVGTTNSAGRAIVTDLISRQRNRIAIDPKNLPVDAEVRETRTTVVPAERSGVVVKFGVKPNANAAEVVFIGPDRRPLEVGAEGRLQGATESFFVGYDGRAFVRGLAERNVVSIKLPSGPTCRAEFTYAQQPGQVVVINDVVCR